MAKRTAQKQLTMDNFDQEDDEDYAGDNAGPQLASEEILKARPMAKAKRRSDLNSSVAEESKKPAFSGFGGFKGFATNTSQNPSFNAFKSMTQMETNDNTFKSTVSSTQTNGGKPLPTSNPRSDSTEDMTTEDSDDIYNNKLSELNKCFFQHINSYMSRSEFFDFTQVCKEYIEYHKKIETESKTESVSASSSGTTSSTSGIKIQTISSSSFIPSPSSLPSTYSTSSAPFQSSQSVFGSQLTTSTSQSSSPIATSQTSSVLFSSQTSSKDDKPSTFAKPTIQFGLTANKPLSAGTTSLETASATTGDNDNAAEESDEPPKVESVEHNEPDSVFSRKCKLYFKKGDDWSNKGVGYLYIKKDASSSSAAQLLIRADNKLGTILLHISLNDSIPISKAPQNRGVYLSCIPNPPIDPKANTQTSVSFLIKVKTEDTEHLFDTLIKYKSNQ